MRLRKEKVARTALPLGQSDAPTSAARGSISLCSFGNVRERPEMARREWREDEMVAMPKAPVTYMVGVLIKHGVKTTRCRSHRPINHRCGVADTPVLSRAPTEARLRFS